MKSTTNIKSLFILTALLAINLVGNANARTCDSKETLHECQETEINIGIQVPCLSGGTESEGRNCSREDDLGMCHRTKSQEIATVTIEQYVYEGNALCSSSDDLEACLEKLQNSCEENGGGQWTLGENTK